MNKLLSILLLFFALQVQGQNFFWSHNFTDSAPVDTCTKYGLLYNWYVTDLTGGDTLSSSNEWIVPDTADYNELADYIGANGDYGSNTVGGKLKKTGFDFWEIPNEGATDEYNFSGVGAGARDTLNGFDLINSNMFLWTTATESANESYIVILEAESNIFKCGFWYTPIKNASSIRLVRDATESELLLADGTFVDNYIQNDLKKIPAVKIGIQVWTTNLIETKFRNGDIIPFHGNDNDSTFTNTEWSNLAYGAACAYNDSLELVGCDFAWPACENSIIAAPYTPSVQGKLAFSTDGKDWNYKIVTGLNDVQCYYHVYNFGDMVYAMCGAGEDWVNTFFSSNDNGNTWSVMEIPGESDDFVMDMAYNGNMYIIANDNPNVVNS
jgi:uncharacterized protein (TIGR02145 family)